MGKGEKHTPDQKGTLGVPMTVELKGRVRAYAQSLDKELSQVGRAAIEHYLDSPEARLQQLERQLKALQNTLTDRLSRLDAKVWQLERKVRAE